MCQRDLNGQTNDMQSENNISFWKWMCDKKYVISVDWLKVLLE